MKTRNMIHRILAPLSWICPRCGAPNTSGAICANCGGGS
jgi:ribosomal protein L32